MNVSVEKQTFRFDKLKWLIVAALLLCGLAANYLYVGQPLPFRIIGWIVLLGITAFIVLQTEKGHLFLSFARESRVELRKVFWPSRQEVVQMTIVITLMVVATSIVLWGLDTFLLWAVGWLTGQRG